MPPDRQLFLRFDTPEQPSEQRQEAGTPKSPPPSPEPTVHTAELRTRIARQLREGHFEDALHAFEELRASDPAQCLPAEQQLAIGRAYYDRQPWPEAAAAFETYVQSYRSGSASNEVRLLLGIITARELRQYAQAEKHLQEALERATTPDRKQQAAHWLEEVRSLLHGPETT